MERIAIILLIFVLLLNGRHAERLPRPGTKAILVSAHPLPLNSSVPDQRMLGDLRYLNGWALTANFTEFGGISSMSVDDAGHIVALDDGGGVTTFRTGLARSPGTFRPLPAAASEMRAPKLRWDTESMTRDPVTGTIWVGYEGDGRICRYAAAFARVERCARSEAAAKWPPKTSMESLAKLPDGRFLAIAEEAPGPAGRDHDVLLFAGDPVDPATPPPARLSYVAPLGYLPTDAVAIGHGKLLVLNRRITLMDLFTAVLMLVDVHDLHPGAVLHGREVARFSPPIQHDNFEALAISREGDRHVLWVASDDNHMFFQRSLLLKFAMPDRWFEEKDGTKP